MYLDADETEKQLTQRIKKESPSSFLNNFQLPLASSLLRLSSRLIFDHAPGTRFDLLRKLSLGRN